MREHDDPTIGSTPLATRTPESVKLFEAVCMGILRRNGYQTAAFNRWSAGMTRDRGDHQPISVYLQRRARAAAGLLRDVSTRG